MLNPMQKAIIFLGVCVAGVVCLDKCAPDCTGKQPGDKVADPMNCTQYYLCLIGEVPANHPLGCQSGEIFNGSHCVIGSNCNITCQPTSCHSRCDSSFALVTDPSNCSQYFVCFPYGLVGPYECPVGSHYFDGEKCVDDEGACCPYKCTAYCDATATQVPDPSDCTKYYICMDKGPASEAYHFQCDAGENFNIVTGLCESGAPCVTFCEGSTSSTPPTVTVGCVDSLTCTSLGSFAMCNTCQKEFFYCNTVGQEASIDTCTGDLVFNTDPAYPFCVLPTNCPYHPPYDE